MNKLVIGRRISFYTSDEAKRKLEIIAAHLESIEIKPTKSALFSFMLSCATGQIAVLDALKEQYTNKTPDI